MQSKARGLIDYLTERRWFYFLLLIMFLTTPPFSSAGYSWFQLKDVILSALSNAVIYSLSDLFWPSLMIHVMIILILAMMIFNRQLAVKLFNWYAFILYSMIAVGQNIAFTEKYGLVVLVGNLILTSITAILWGWETLSAKRNTFEKANLSLSTMWLAPLAFFAFWDPQRPLADPCLLIRCLIAGYYGTAYCMTTPLILTIMIVFYPGVNRSVMRYTAFPGLLFATISVLAPKFSLAPFWSGVTHVPLLLTSLYALLLSWRDIKS